ncbi:MAG: tripartite tricarboxylate transporter substrate-binding protein [Burkholderiaceae bacterium]|nr:tripartite tricarboxylate transporter substrate-binding protein [Burkholderiaceae bacterium]
MKRELVTHPPIRVNDFSELVALSQSHPCKVAYGSAGAGSSAHLSMELSKPSTAPDRSASRRSPRWPGSPQGYVETIAAELSKAGLRRPAFGCQSGLNMNATECRRHR